MRVIDRLIDLLPVPVLVTAAAFVAAAWLVKLFRDYPGYAQVATDKYFQCLSVALIASLVIYFIIGRAEPFSANEKGVVIAAFEGDISGSAHRHTVETLRDELRKKPALASARIVEIGNVVSDDTAAQLLRARNATSLIAGSVISDNLVWYRMYWRNQPATQMSVNGFPDISEFKERFVAQFSAKDLLTSSAILPSSLSENSYQSAQKLALVIGNSQYKDAGLLGPEVDARLMEQEFQRLGIDVRVILNGKRDQILDEITRLFSEAERRRSIVYIYYSGHGSPDQPAGILPVDDLTRPIRLSQIAGIQSIVSDTDIFIFLDTMAGSFADVNSPRVSVLAAGQVGEKVQDTPEGGIFTRELIRALGERTAHAGDSVTFDELANNVSRAVVQRTSNNNRPISLSFSQKVVAIAPKSAPNEHGYNGISKLR